MRRIEHLRALQAFNAVASRESFSLAARDLSVTQGAVSRQIKQLEQYLGVSLFRRTSAGVEVTRAGERLREATRQAFSLLERAIAETRREPEKKSLTITLPPALATKWLVPRLPLLRAQLRGLEIFLDTSDEIIDFADSEVDVGLRFARKRTDGLFWDLISVETKVAVASPHLLRGRRLPLTPRAIARLPILNDDYDPRWADWAARAGLPEGALPAPHVRFMDSAVMISAAIDGQGVALARRRLVADDLAAGRLVRLDAIEVPVESPLHFVCRNGDQDRPPVRRLLAWLHSL